MTRASKPIDPLAEHLQSIEADLRAGVHPTRIQVWVGNNEGFTDEDRKRLIAHIEDVCETINRKE